MLCRTDVRNEEKRKERCDVVTDKQSGCMKTKEEEVALAPDNTVYAIMKLLEKASDREVDLTYHFIKSMIKSN